LDILLEVSKYLRPQPVLGQGCGSLVGGAASVNLPTEAHMYGVFPFVCFVMPDRETAKYMVCDEARMNTVETVMMLGETCLHPLHNVFMDS
jgi:hypothetical protein